MTVVLLVEGDTESALKTHLKGFLDKQARVAGKPLLRLETRSEINLAPHKLQHRVELELKKQGVTAVVGLIDVFPKFKNAAEAKAYLKNAAGHHPQFYAHAAQYDVEAWLLPYWSHICQRLGVQQQAPGNQPEMVNDTTPPAYYLHTLYRLAKPKPCKYVKTIEMQAILKNQDLTIASQYCPELKAFLNTLLRLGDLPLLV